MYDSLKGSSYIQLPQELRNSTRGLVNIKNDNNECFRWCHIRYLNPQKKYPQGIKKSAKEVLLELDYAGIEFPVSVKDYAELGWKNKININVFDYENKQFYPIYRGGSRIFFRRGCTRLLRYFNTSKPQSFFFCRIPVVFENRRSSQGGVGVRTPCTLPLDPPLIYVSKECNEDVLMNLLLITKDEKKHYVLIKDVNSLIRPNTRRKSIFACTVSNVLAAKRYSQAQDQLYDYQR